MLRRTTRISAATVLAGAGLALLTGCGGGGDGASSTPLSASAKTPEGLTATLTETSADIAESGGTAGQDHAVAMFNTSTDISTPSLYVKIQ